MRTLPLLENKNSGGDKVKDFFGKRHHEAAGQRSQGFLTLAGGLVVTFAKEILDLITA